MGPLDGIGFWPIVSVSADNQDLTIGRPLAPPKMLIVGPLRANLLTVKNQVKKQLFSLTLQYLSIQFG